MTLIAKGPYLNEFEVADIRPDSPAANADIRKKDILYKINGARVADSQLKDLSQLLRRRDGKKIRFVFLRDGEKIKTSLRLRDII
ncbi:PDZ domain-containing protein [Cesiribacter andamanensis]|nr:PDZ domain-containing protein [Cesiribacter andamanensis]